MLRISIVPGFCSQPHLHSLPVPLQPLGVQTDSLTVLLDNPVGHWPRVVREETLDFTGTFLTDKPCHAHMGEITNDTFNVHYSTCIAVALIVQTHP